MVIKTLVLFILSLFGIGAGFLVSMIAVEELTIGKRYFRYLKISTLLLISLFFIWQTIFLKEFVALVIFMLLLLSVFFLDVHTKTLRVELAYYTLFLGTLLFLMSIGVTFSEQIVFATLITLYGFVPGTLLHIRLIEGKSRTYN